MGFIQPTSTLHSVLVLFVKKKDGSLCLYIDFYSFNHIFKKNHYPLPLISNLLDLSYKTQVYLKINLYYAYHLVYIANGDKWKAVFRTCYESFKWSVMSFSLTNTPMTFQQFMNDIFSNFLDVYVMIYLSTQITCPNTTSMLNKYSNIFTRLAFMPKQKNMNFTLSQQNIQDIFFLLLVLLCPMTK